MFQNINLFYLAQLFVLCLLSNAHLLEGLTACYIGVSGKFTDTITNLGIVTEMDFSGEEFQTVSTNEAERMRNDKT